MVSFFSKAWFLCDRPDLPTGTIGTIIWKPGLIQTNFGLYSNTLRTARPETTAIKKYCARALQELLHIARYNRCLLQFNLLVTFPRKKGVVVFFRFILKEQATGISDFLYLSRCCFVPTWKEKDWSFCYPLNIHRIHKG